VSWGRILAGSIVLVALVVGIAVRWLQTRAFYVSVDEAAMTVVPAEGGAARPVPVSDFRGIDSDSSPIRYRACFQMDTAVLGDAAAASDAEPLTAPGWFDCFDAAAIGAALEGGEARAILSRANEPYGIDRIIALYPDGRGYAWTQINRCGEVVFDGRPTPEGCPPRPEES
jgi:Family of unknown function (DUF6446)